MKAVPYILGISQGVVKEMAGYSHTLTSCLSKLRSSLEAGKKQPRVWLQYVCDVTEMLLYPSFRVPLVLLLSPYGDSEMARNGFLDEPSGRSASRRVTLVPKVSRKPSAKMARSGTLRTTHVHVLTNPLFYNLKM